MGNLPFGVGIDAQNIPGADAARYQGPSILLWRCVYPASSIHYKHGAPSSAVRGAWRRCDWPGPLPRLLPARRLGEPGSRRD